MKSNSTLGKMRGEWWAGYIGQDKINHYIASSKTKDQLIHDLINRIIKNEGLR